MQQPIRHQELLVPILAYDIVSSDNFPGVEVRHLNDTRAGHGRANGRNHDLGYMRRLPDIEKFDHYFT